MESADNLTSDAWSWTDTAKIYAAFSERHDRYQQANAALVHHACMESDLRVLDFAAGTGQTARCVLDMLHDKGRILCCEPSSAMRAEGERGLSDPRVSWAADPPSQERFDRVLCGAGIWQCQPLNEAIASLADLLDIGGALCFNIPAAYLGVPDDPGGGRDPYLLELINQLADPDRVSTAEPLDLPTPAGMARMLTDAGLRPEAWQMKLKLTQAAFRDWMKIPVINQPFFEGLTVAERVRRIDAAYAQVDPESWRWEAWLGWTAWRDR